MTQRWYIEVWHPDSRLATYSYNLVSESKPTLLELMTNEWLEDEWRCEEHDPRLYEFEVFPCEPHQDDRLPSLKDMVAFQKRMEEVWCSDEDDC